MILIIIVVTITIIIIENSDSVEFSWSNSLGSFSSVWLDLEIWLGTGVFGSDSALFPSLLLTIVLTYGYRELLVTTLKYYSYVVFNGITALVPLTVVAWHSGNRPVFGRRTFPVLRSTCIWRVTSYMVNSPPQVRQLG